MSNLDLLVFGDTAIDNFYEVGKLPSLNEASDVSKSHRFYGGMGANTAVVARTLGLEVGLVSVIGTDAEDYRKYMEGMGIKLLLKGVFGDTTKSMFFKENGNQISFFYKGVTEMLDNLDPEEEFGKRLNRKTKAVYMARTYLEMQRKVVKMYKDSFTVYNPGYGVFKFDRIPRLFKAIVRESDVLVLNHHELEHLNKLGFKVRMGVKPRVFIVTRGEKGCRVHTKNTSIDVNPYKTKVVDTSGAGDAFNAGFLAGMIKGHDVYQSVAIGNAAASFIVEAWGCQTNIPKWPQVIERYDKIR
ncbi:MAG: PfkB family carbohydrate kinase [Candidatus Altiarchaeota archaeon]